MFPGELTPEERQEWVSRFLAMAEQAWGSKRASEIAEDVERTALAVGSVLKLDFIRDEPPGFYLGASFQDASDEWKVG